MALDLTKTFAEVFGSERTTGQTVIDSDGNLKWALHNLYDNGTGGAQNITVESGVDYTIRAATGSIAYSNAATGTLATGGSVSRVEVTAGSTTLTITPTAATEIAVYRSDLDGMQFDRYGSDYLPNETGAALYQVGVAHDANGTVIGGQFFEGRTQLTTYPTITTANWIDIGGIASTDLTENKLGAFPGVKVASGGSVVDLLRVPNTTSVTSGTEYAVSVIWEDGDSGSIYFSLDETSVGSSSYSVTTGGTLSLIGTATKGTATLSRHVEIAAGLYETTLIWTPNFTGTATYAIGPNSATATEFINVYAGSFMVGSSYTPFIPANGSSVTRGADSFPKATSTFGYNQTEGFVVAEFQSAGSDGAVAPKIWQVDDGTNSNRILGQLSSANAGQAFSILSSAATAAITLGAYTPDEMSKLAFGFKADNFAASLDGAAVVTDTSGALPGALTTFRLGTDSAPAFPLNGYIKRLIYFPFKPDNATIVEEAT